MGFGESIQSFFTNYVKFTGRARRSEYWFVTLFLFLTTLGATVIDAALFDGDVDDFLLDGGWGVFGVLWGLAVLLPSIALLVRRLHDSDKSAWWILILLVPFAGVIVLFVFTLLDSTPGENKHGPSPKEAVQ
jgi:uncharacterized membrane protein YhaH (DUF805 family)